MLDEAAPAGVVITASCGGAAEALAKVLEKLVGECEQARVLQCGARSDDMIPVLLLFTRSGGIAAEEVLGFIELVQVIFGTLGMEDYRVRVGLRDPDSSKYVGEPEKWDRAEQACRDAAASLGVPFTEEEGEAAFYGPKIDFVVRDVLGREWQLGTVQVDYNLPERFDLSYVGADGEKHRPVMIHRAPFGSMERFCGVLIEHFGGMFPTWLSLHPSNWLWQYFHFLHLFPAKCRKII